MISRARTIGFIMSEIQPASHSSSEFNVEIAASGERVWRALFDDINLWWLPEFHVVGEGSTVAFDPSLGGHGLIETASDGSWLQWYSVQMYLPTQRKIYLVGHVAPDWGGPAISHLRLAVEETSGGSMLNVLDAQFGNVSDSSAQSSVNGWKQLFTDGLKTFVETQITSDKHSSV